MRSVVLQNRGVITCGQKVDEAVALFIRLVESCHAQTMASAAAGPGWEKVYVGKEEVEMTHMKRGDPREMWLAFRLYYDQAVKEDASGLE